MDIKRIFKLTHRGIVFFSWWRNCWNDDTSPQLSVTLSLISAVWCMLPPSSLVGDCQLTVKIKTIFAPLPCLLCRGRSGMCHHGPAPASHWLERRERERATAAHSQARSTGETLDIMVLGPLCSLNSDPDTFKKMYNILPPSQKMYTTSKEAFIFLKLETQGSSREF